MSLEERLVERIQAEGPLRFDEYLQAALYDPDGGFFAGEGRAGRGGDFLTSPEVGPLFGAVMANAVDTWWDEAGRPAEWRVVDAGAGSGALLRSILAAQPACLDALRPIAVERSAAQRAEHGTEFESRTDLPDSPITGVIIANELLDNLPWRLLECSDDRDDGWREVVVTERDGVELVEVVEQRSPVPDLEGLLHELLPEAVPRARIAWQAEAFAWLSDVLERVERGRVVVVDYATTTADMAARPWSDWTRTYRGHERGGHPLDLPGSQDITCEVAVDQLALVRTPSASRTQAEFLRHHGLDDLVAEGRRVWSDRAHIGDLDALKARSRVGEAEALTDSEGLGAFTALEWSIG